MFIILTGKSEVGKATVENYLLEEGIMEFNKKEFDCNKDYCAILNYNDAEKQVKQFGVSNCFVIDLCKENCNNNKDIINFTLNISNMSIESVVFAVISALKEYKKNIRGNYQRVKIKRKFCDTNFWEQPEIVYIPEFELIKN